MKFILLLLIELLLTLVIGTLSHQLVEARSILGDDSLDLSLLLVQRLQLSEDLSELVLKLLKDCALLCSLGMHCKQTLH